MIVVMLLQIFGICMTSNINNSPNIFPASSSSVSVTRQSPYLSNTVNNALNIALSDTVSSVKVHEKHPCSDNDINNIPNTTLSGTVNVTSHTTLASAVNTA